MKKLVESYIEYDDKNDILSATPISKPFTENAVEGQICKLGEHSTSHHEQQEQEKSNKKINEIILENAELKEQLASLKDKNNDKLIKKIKAKNKNIVDIKYLKNKKKYELSLKDHTIFGPVKTKITIDDIVLGSKEAVEKSKQRGQSQQTYLIIDGKLEIAAIAQYQNGNKHGNVVTYDVDNINKTEDKNVFKNVYSDFYEEGDLKQQHYCAKNSEQKIVVYLNKKGGVDYMTDSKHKGYKIYLLYDKKKMSFYRTDDAIFLNGGFLYEKQSNGECLERWLCKGKKETSRILYKDKNKKNIIQIEAYELTNGVPDQKKVIKFFEGENILHSTYYMSKQQKNGEYTEYYESGQVKEEGHCLSDKKNGKYTEYYESGQVKEECHYSSDKLEGKYISYYESGQVKEEKDCEEGQEVGLYFQKKKYNANGYLQPGENQTFVYTRKDKKPDKDIDTIEKVVKSDLDKITFNNGKTHFKVSFIDKDGNKYIKEYNVNGKLMSAGRYDKDGKKNGYISEFTVNGKWQNEGEYVNGKKTGTHISYWVNTGKYKSILKVGANEENCLYKEYYSDGKLLFEGTKNIKNGELDGTLYSKNGKLLCHGKLSKDYKLVKGQQYNLDGKLIFEGEYLDGKKIGKGKTYEYNDAGEIIATVEAEYVAGKCQGKEFDKNGNLIFEGEYLNGKRHGKGKEINSETGKLIFDGEYLYGKKHGKGKEYNKDGKLIFEGEYVYGKKNGKGTRYDISKKVATETAFYVNGLKLGPLERFNYRGESVEQYDNYDEDYIIQQKKKEKEKEEKESRKDVNNSVDDYLVDCSLNPCCIQ